MSVVVDRTSLVAEVTASLTLAAVEVALANEGLTLALAADAPMDLSVSAWLARGAPGARDPFRDPADHLVAGLDARLVDGNELRVRPGPRRAAGPDLVALFVGTAGRFGEIVRAHLRVHPVGVRRPEAAAFARTPEPPLNEGERALLDAVERELGV
jgi:alkyldihydroxyacetonephosphate synthase